MSLWFRKEIQTVPRPAELRPSGNKPRPLQVAVGIVTNRDGQVLVNQRPAGSEMAGYWEFPGGKRAAGETGRQTLTRELDEELGIRVQGAERLARFIHDYPKRTVELEVWRVTAYQGEPLSREGQRLAWHSVADLNVLRLLPADGPIVQALVSAQEG